MEALPIKPGILICFNSGLFSSENVANGFLNQLDNATEKYEKTVNLRTDAIASK